MPELCRQGYSEYSRIAKAYVARKTSATFEIARGEIETDYDEISSRLQSYAARSGLSKPPVSLDWGNALLNFLKSNPDQAAERFAKVKGVLLEPSALEARVCAAFLKELHEKSNDQFDKIVRIMMGVLIEAFISSIGDIGELNSKGRPNVYLDTSVILRLLGCSGSILKVATQELIQYLQDLRIPVYFLSGNETEAAGILNTIVFVKDSGKQLEGETAEAISNGEVSITDIRLLQNSFGTALAKQNVFPADNMEVKAQANAKWQIDERDFSNFLLTEANRLKRPYSGQNRENDASYLGTIMRLRQGHVSRDLLESRHIFVTTNKLLATTARRYLHNKRVLPAQSCPPILSVGQLATIAWLIKDRKLAPEKVGRELLANCYAAVSPDADWFRNFREGYEKAAGPLKDEDPDQHSSLVLQAARRIAKEESFGNSALVRELNMAEILSKAEEAANRVVDEVRRVGAQELQKEREEAETRLAKLAEAKAIELQAAQDHHEEARSRLEAEKVAATDEAARIAAENALKNIQDRNRQKAERAAHRLMGLVRAVWTLAFVGSSVYVWYYQLIGSNSNSTAAFSFLLVVVGTLGFLDMIGIPLAKRWVASLEETLTSIIQRMLDN